MIVLPFLAGISALIKLILEGAVFGAIFGGAIAGGAAAINEYQTHGEINRQAVENIAKQTGEGAVGGAITGGVIGVAGTALHPVLTMIDDFFRSIFGWFDDAAKSVGSAVDDAASGIKKALENVAKSIRGQFNRWRNGWNAQNFKTLKEPPADARYVYVMEDAANGLHKIGMTTKSPPKRLKQIESEAKIKPDYTCIIQTDKNSKLEGELHAIFSNQRTLHPSPHNGRTEWFALSAAQVAAACSF